MKRIAALLPLVLGACIMRLGTHPSDFPPARRAAGTAGTITTTGITLQGELLEVRDTALVVLTRDQVALIKNAAISALAFPEVREVLVLPLGERDRRDLRLLSRFPQGMPAAALSTLLRSTGQTNMLVIAP